MSESTRDVLLIVAWLCAVSAFLYFDARFLFDIGQRPHFRVGFLKFGKEEWPVWYRINRVFAAVAFGLGVLFLAMGVWGLLVTLRVV